MSSSTRPPRAAKLPNSTTLTNPHTHSASTLASSSTTSSFQPTLPPPPSTSSTPLSSHPTFSSTTTRAAAAAAAAAAASVVPSTSTNAATTATATTTPTTTSKRLTKTKQLLDEHGPMKKPVSIIHKSHPVVTKPMSHMSIASIPSVQEQNEKADWLPPMDFESWNTSSLRKYKQVFKLPSNRSHKTNPPFLLPSLQWGSSMGRSEMIEHVSKHYYSWPWKTNETDILLYFLFSLQHPASLLKPPFEVALETVREMNKRKYVPSSHSNRSTHVSSVRHPAASSNKYYSNSPR